MQITPSLTVSVSGTINCGIAVNNLKHDWSVPQGLKTTGWTGSANVNIGSIRVAADSAEETPFGLFGIKSYTIDPGFAVTIGITSTWDLNDMKMTLAFGVLELHPFIKVYVTYTNGKISQSFEIGVDLGWLTSSISPSITIPRGIFFN